ncbi:MAG: chemotaxis protein CheV [Nitrospinae bacterium]|nr:chemotaxis protein CheV [Nitrospinota bacterium]
MSTQQEILLESGTNEFEIVEFVIANQSYGVNVAKVREIIQYDAKAVTQLPENHPSMLGLYFLRGDTFPLIDLSVTLKVDKEKQPARQVILVCEFNALVNGFLVDGVRQIRRCSWEDVKPVTTFQSQYRPMVTSTVHIEDRQILILDLEHIISVIYPDTGVTFDEEKLPPKEISRGEARLVIAEDSPLIREAIIKILRKVGYANAQVFTNGKDAFDEVTRVKRSADEAGVDISEMLNGVITDIEMPQMDGLTFCKRVRTELNLPNLPVIMFSSMINEQMAAKCRDVGANAFTTKPQTSHLVEIIDYYCLKK